MTQFRRATTPIPPAVAPPLDGATSLATRLTCFFAALACVSAALLAVQEQSAARMLLWPWQLLYWLGPLAAGGAFFCSLYDRDPAMPTLPRLWTWSLAAAAAAIIASTLASPVRDQILPWCAWPLALLALTATTARMFAHRTAGVVFQHYAWIGLGGAGAILSATSLVMWASDLGMAFSLRADSPFAVAEPLSHILSSRNSQPLGHVNYTAGSALLFLPILASLAWTSRGSRRALWSLATALCLGMFFSGGSRGAFLGLAAVLALVAIWVWHTRRLPRWLLCTVAIVLLGAGWMHPSVRGRLLPPPPDAPVNVSNEQRKTWVYGGLLAAADRPLFGWGAGSAPWVFAKYRHHFDYGPATMLQLHSLPVQILAEGGIVLAVPAAGLALLAGLAAFRRLRRRNLLAPGSDVMFWAAGAGALGYGIFSFTDYQLDLPIIAVSLAMMLGLLAASETSDSVSAPRRPRAQWGLVLVGAVTAFVWVGVSWVSQREIRLREVLGRGDWATAARIAPNDAALRVYVADRLIRSSADNTTEEASRLRSAAIELLERNTQTGLALELSHSMLGWQRLPSDPAQAHVHFVSARASVPNHLSALLGSALASLADAKPDRATRELVAACLAHPRFIASGWWRDENLSALKPRVFAQLKRALDELATSPALRPGEQADAAYLHALVDWLEEKPGALELVAEKSSGARQRFWAALANPPAHPPVGMPAGLAAALAPTTDDPKAPPPWISALELARRRPIIGGYGRERAWVNEAAPEVLVYTALASLPASPWPYYVTRKSRGGFPRQHRHMNLQGINDGLASIENAWADLLTPIWPDPNWIPHRHFLPFLSREPL